MASIRLAFEKNQALFYVLTAKELLRQGNQLVEEPCLFCQVPQVEVTEEQKSQLASKNLLRIELFGFHCANPAHIQLVHDAIGAVRWSCCPQFVGPVLPQEATDETAATQSPAGSQ